MACWCTKYLFLSVFGKIGNSGPGEFRFPIRTRLGDQVVAMLPILHSAHRKRSIFATLQVVHDVMSWSLTNFQALPKRIALKRPGVPISHFGSFTANTSTCSIRGG
jgi:hypothetical protein